MTTPPPIVGPDLSIPDVSAQIDYGPYVESLTSTPYRRSTPCRLPISDMASWMYDLVRNGLAFINPLSNYYAFSGQLAIDLGGCFNHLLTTDDIFNSGGLNKKSLADVLGPDKFATFKKQAELVSTIAPLEPPPGFPKDFVSFFPDGFKPGFEADFMAGLPDASKYGLPPTFKASFDAQIARVRIADMTTAYVSALATLGVLVPPAGLKKVFVDRYLAFASWEAIPQEDFDWLLSCGVPIDKEFAKEQDYINKLNALRLLVPPGSFPWYIPSNEVSIPPAGFTGFSPDFVSRINSQWQQDKTSLDLLSGAQQAPMGVSTQKLDLMTAAGTAYSAYQIMETSGFTSSNPAAAMDGVFGVLTGSLDEKYTNVGTALGSLANLICGSPSSAVESILKGEVDAAMATLKAAMDFIKNEIGKVTLAHLANVALNMLFGKSNALLQLMIPRVSGAQNYCGALDKLTKAIESPALTDLFGAVSELPGGLERALQPKSVITGQTQV